MTLLKAAALGCFLAVLSSSITSAEGQVPASEPPPEYQDRSLLTRSGDTRRWLLRLPQSHRAETCHDVVFDFHGSGSSAEAQFRYSDFSAIADRENFILVTPDANKEFYDRDNELADYWDHAWEAKLRERDYDIDFVLELVELLKEQYCTSDFFATGMSAGGDMTSALACLHTSPFKAFASVTYRYYEANECNNAGPRPHLSFQGDQDRVVPIEGLGSPWFDKEMSSIMAFWANHNSCAEEPQLRRVADDVVHFFWHNCSAQTEWYLIEGGGHTWPGATENARLGPTTASISASELIWQFFDAQ